MKGRIVINYTEFSYQYVSLSHPYKLQLNCFPMKLRYHISAFQNIKKINSVSHCLSFKFSLETTDM